MSQALKSERAIGMEMNFHFKLNFPLVRSLANASFSSSAGTSASIGSGGNTSTCGAIGGDEMSNNSDGVSAMRVNQLKVCFIKEKEIKRLDEIINNLTN